MLKTLAFATLVATLALGPAQARPRHHFPARIDANGNDSVTYLPHPAGCPRIAFCGCGARKALGIDDARLNLANNWPRLYRGSTPIAHWSHHVAIVREMYGDGTALLEDYNSGGHLSRLHRRSIAGAQILGGGAGAYASSESRARNRHSHVHTRYAVAEPPAAPDVAVGAH